MSNSDWLTVPSEEIWETIKDRVVETTKETWNNINIDEDAVENVLESMIDNGRIDGHIETMVENTIDYNYDILDSDNVIDIIADQWRDGEYEAWIKEYIDERHGEDTATSTELYDQVQDLTKKVDHMQKTISVIVSSMASVVAFVHQGE